MPQDTSWARAAESAIVAKPERGALRGCPGTGVRIAGGRGPGQASRCGDRQPTWHDSPMQRRTLLRKLGEGLALAVGHPTCRAADIAPAEPAPKAAMPLPEATPSVALSADLSTPSTHCVDSCHALVRIEWEI